MKLGVVSFYFVKGLNFHFKNKQIKTVFTLEKVTFAPFIQTKWARGNGFPLVFLLSLLEINNKINLPARLLRTGNENINQSVKDRQNENKKKADSTMLYMFR